MLWNVWYSLFLQMMTKLKNIVFLSSTGNGKSSTCNFILGRQYFAVGNDLASCTFASAQQPCPKLGINIIDTPGFGDTRFDEKQIDNVMCQLTTKVIKLSGESTNRIDAFVLVIKCTPRATTLKENLTHMCDIFGSQALKSLVLLIITPNKYYNYTDEQVQESFEQMTAITSLISKARGKPFDQDCYVRWDNKTPRPNQVENLMEKIELVQSYTHQKFVQAQEEIQRRLDEAIQERVQQKTLELKMQYQGNEKKLRQQVKAFEKECQRQKQVMKERAQKAAETARGVIAAMEELSQNHQEQMKQQLAIIQQNSRKLHEQRIKQAQQQQQEQEERARRFNQMQQQNNRKQQQMMQQMMQIQQRQPTVVYQQTICSLF